jgi:hypothetical protein
MAKVLNELRTQRAITQEGLANVTTSTYTVPVDIVTGEPLVSFIRVYNACVITMPTVKDGYQIAIVSKYDDISPSNAVLIVPETPASETVLGQEAYALTWPRESIVLLGDTNATPDDWGAI